MSSKRRVSSSLTLFPSLVLPPSRDTSRPNQRYLRQGLSHSRFEAQVEGEGREGEGRGWEEEAVEIRAFSSMEGARSRILD